MSRSREAFDYPPRAVFRAAEAARPMLDDDLADLEPAGVRKYRHKAMQLAVQAHFVKDLAAVSLHAAIVVVQPDTGYGADHPVEHTRRINLVPGIMADLLPAADNVEPQIHVREKLGNLVRVVLQVSVERGQCARRAPG